MGIKNLRLRPTRSVRFIVEDFCVPIKRSSPSRHRIYAKYNYGFTATPEGLSVGKIQNLPLYDENRTLMADGQIKLCATFAGRQFRAVAGGHIVFFSNPLASGDFSQNNDNKWLEVLESESAGSFLIDSKYGYIVDIGVVNGKLLIVQQFALSALDAPYDSNGFNLQLLTISYKEIVPGTARTLGDSVFFLTFGGMCRFDGRNITLLDIDFGHVSEAQYFSFIYENRYYLADVDKREQALVIERFFESCFFLDTSATRQDAKSNLIWESSDFALGYAATRQFVQQVRIRTSGDAVIIIQTEQRQQRIVLNGRDAIQTVNINLKGGVFKVRLESNDSNIKISDLSVVIGFVSNSIGTIRIG